MEFTIKIIGILAVSFMVRAITMSRFMEMTKEKPELVSYVPVVDSFPTFISIVLTIILFH